MTPHQDYLTIKSECRLSISHQEVFVYTLGFPKV